jgi:hypothetical protein
MDAKSTHKLEIPGHGAKFVGKTRAHANNYPACACTRPFRVEGHTNLQLQLYLNVRLQPTTSKKNSASRLSQTSFFSYNNNINRRQYEIDH